MGKDIERKITKKSQVRIDRERTQRRYLIITAVSIIVIIIGIITYGLIDEYVLTKYKAVAKVEGETITVAQFQKQVGYQRWQLVQQYINTVQTSQLFGNDPTFRNYFESLLDQITTQLNNPEEIGENVLNIMIDDLIIKQQAKNMGISVSDQDVEEALQAAFGYYPKGTPTPEPTYPIVSTSTLSPTQYAIISPTPTYTGIPTSPDLSPTVDTKFTTSTPLPTLTPTLTPTQYTLEGYQDQLKQYIDQLVDINFAEEDLKSLIRYQLLREKVTEKVTADIPDTEERVWARHILVSTENAAIDVINKLENGEDFSLLASELSQDTASKDNGGDLGWFGRGKMVKEFEDAAFSLEIGEISQPIKTQFGYHVIQVLGHENLELTKAELDNLRQEKFNEWLSTQKESINVEKFDIWKNVVPIAPALPTEFLQY